MWLSFSAIQLDQKNFSNIPNFLTEFSFCETSEHVSTTNSIDISISNGIGIAVKLKWINKYIIKCYTETLSCFAERCVQIWVV